MTPDYVPNPLIDVVVLLHEARDEPIHIDVSSYSTVRGFAKTRLSRGEDVSFDAALRLLCRDDDADLAALKLSAAEKRSLWQAGLIVSPRERGDTLVSESFPAVATGFDRQGFALIGECITPAATACLAAHYRDQIARGQLRRDDRLTDRYVVYNDAAARVVQRELLGAVEALVGSPIKGSYAYAQLYCGGAALPAHTDRQPNKYTMSLVIDHQPIPADGLSPWPLQFFGEPGAPPLECFQPIGGGAFFRGGEVRHGHPTPLPPNEQCWVMLLAYVDSSFDGSLD